MYCKDRCCITNYILSGMFFFWRKLSGMLRVNLRSQSLCWLLTVLFMCIWLYRIWIFFFLSFAYFHICFLCFMSTLAVSWQASADRAYFWQNLCKTPFRKGGFAGSPQHMFCALSGLQRAIADLAHGCRMWLPTPTCLGQKAMSEAAWPWPATPAQRGFHTNKGYSEAQKRRSTGSVASQLTYVKCTQE